MNVSLNTLNINLSYGKITNKILNFIPYFLKLKLIDSFFSLLWSNVQPSPDAITKVAVLTKTSQTNYIYVVKSLADK